MNDIPNPQYGKSASTTQGQNNDDNRLTADVYDDFLDALDLLYIKANMGGRLKFLENWSYAAKYIFGEELIGFDHDGTHDIERRAALEDEAEERRLALLEIVETLEARSVEKSVLQVEYVEGVVQKMGRDLSLLLYAPKIVNRFIPNADGGAEVAVVADIVRPTGNEIPDPFQERAPQKAIIPEIDDHLDAVQPISLEQAPPPPKPRPQEPVSPAPDIPAPMDVPVPEVADVPLERPVDPPVAPPLDDAPEEVAPMSPPLEADAMPAVSQPHPEPVVAPQDVPAAPAQPQETPAAAAAAPLTPPVSPPPTEPVSPPDAFLQKPETAAPSDPTVQDSSKSAVHKALDGQEPVASQKMTFMPAKVPEAKQTSLKQGVVPVIGGNKESKDEREN